MRLPESRNPAFLAPAAADDNVSVVLAKGEVWMTEHQEEHVRRALKIVGRESVLDDVEVHRP